MIFQVFLCIILLYIEKSLGYDRYLIIRDGMSVVIPVIFIVHNKDIFVNKQYITVDNRYILLYTVYCKGGPVNMHIILNHSSMVPIYEQLMEQIKTGIIESTLAEGEALPSVRKLAGELRISALTVKKAYDKLEEARFVTTVHGKGTFVAASDKQLALEARRRAVEEEFEKAIDQAKNVGLSKDEILEIVTLLLDES